MTNDSLASTIANRLAIPHVIARIAVERGFRTVPSVYHLLYGEPESELDPYGILGMDKAVRWILGVRARNEPVFIFGDYDLDGMSSVALLVRGLNSVGIATKWRLPNRFGTGYGLSIPAIDEMLSAGARNLITVDTGITANSEIAYANSKGVHTMVIDHHQPSGEGLPACDVLLDPHQDGDSYGNIDLCGVGVAYKFICALFKRMKRTPPPDYLQLVALGTLADLVPMSPENRLFTRLGLSNMWNSPFPGLRELCRVQLAHPQFVGAQGITFKVAPLLNAPGRMEKPDPSLELLLCDDPAKSSKMVSELGAMNTRRKDTENEITKAAIARVHELYGGELPPVLVVDGVGWHLGVIGIVAARLTQEFSRSTAVISVQDDGHASASARAVPGFNWHKALFDCRDLFTRWGGHEIAAGFTLPKEHIAEFRKRLLETASSYFFEEPPEALAPSTIDIALSEIDDSIMQWLARMEPLGGSFPVPVFRAHDVQVKRSRVLSGGHLHLEVSQPGSHRFSAIAFGMGQKRQEIAATNHLETLDFELAWNVYNGERSIQMMVKNLEAAMASPF